MKTETAKQTLNPHSRGFIGSTIGIHSSVAVGCSCLMGFRYTYRAWASCLELDVLVKVFVGYKSLYIA